MLHNYMDVEATYFDPVGEVSILTLSAGLSMIDSLVKVSDVT